MEEFKIFIDRLRNGESELICEEVSSEFLDVYEQELSFPKKVTIHAEAYLTEDHLIVHMKAKTEAFLPCLICNGPTQILLEIDHTHAEPLAELIEPIFDFTEELRETLLLQVPQFAECKGGNCPERKVVNKYLKKSSPEDKTTHFPFAELDESL